MSVPVDENFRKKRLSIAPSYPSYLEVCKNISESGELETIYRVKRMGLVRIMSDKLTLTSGYPVC